MRIFTVSGEPIHLVLLGGGHSHLAVLKHFGMIAPPDVRLTLVSRSVVTPYSGMLPGMIAGHYSPEDAHINLTALARFGLRTALVRNRVGHYFVLLVEQGFDVEFERYLNVEGLQVVLWLNDPEATARLEAALQEAPDE